MLPYQATLTGRAINIIISISCSYVKARNSFVHTSQIKEGDIRYRFRETCIQEVLQLNN